MENASKALIIAGAILLSILLISLGIMIFTQAQDTVNNSGMSQAEINAFNNQFTKYEREKVKGSEIKSLINETIASNSDSNHQSSKALVKITIDDTVVTNTDGNGATAQGATAKAKTDTIYKVEITKYEAGRVAEITITKNNNT